MTYTLSFYVMETFYTIKHPRWWEVWKRAELVTGRQLTRKAFLRIPKDEADLIIAASKSWWNKAEGRLLLRLMGEFPRRIQLEEGTSSAYLTPSEYVRTTNHLYNSAPTSAQP